jgi:hypothetical protein
MLGLSVEEFWALNPLLFAQLCEKHIKANKKSNNNQQEYDEDKVYYIDEL